MCASEAVVVIILVTADIPSHVDFPHQPILEYYHSVSQPRLGTHFDDWLVFFGEPG